MNWYSSLIRMVCLIQGKGAVRYMDSLFLFQSASFEEGFKKALELGRMQEEKYQNVDGKEVKWALKEVVSLDQLPKKLDGCEAYSQPTQLEKNVNYSFDHKFTPEKSQPTETI